MRILGFVPQSRNLSLSLDSINHVDTDGLYYELHYESAGDDPSHTPWQNVTHKYQVGRQMCLDGGYDYLFCMEDDQIVPADALHKLLAVKADIAYGLVTSRHTPHFWSADLVTGPTDDDYVPFDYCPDKAREAWGRVVDVVGCGLYCTLIRREVLAALPFEMRGTRCCDFYFAYDAMKAGYSQRCDTTVLCGHIMNSAAPWRIVWPDPDNRFRYEERAD